MTNIGKSVFTTTIFLMAALFCTLLLSVTTLANEVTVYLNGEKLTYAEATPRIISDRTMVPLTETATHFNMESTWIPETGTMIFTGNGRTMMHTVYEQIIYVNGEAMEFDYGSTIVNDRTLMPIRMLAEAIGCLVDWDGDSAAVQITAPGNQVSTSTADSAGNLAATATSQIYTASLSEAAVDYGDSVTVTVWANLATKRVRITDTSGNTVASSSTYDADENGNYFDISFVPSGLGSITYYIYGGTDADYAATYQSISIAVADSSDITINSIVLDDDEVDTGDTVYVTVKTSANIAKVVVQYGNTTVKTQKSTSSETSSAYTWKVNFTASHSTGTVKYTVYAYDDNDNYEYETFTVYVNADSSSETPSISKVTYDDEVYDGDPVYVTVVTNKAVDVIYIYDTDDYELGYASSYSSSSSSTYTWELSFYPDDEGYYYIYAYDSSESESDYQRIRVYFY